MAEQNERIVRLRERTETLTVRLRETDWVALGRIIQFMRSDPQCLQQPNFTIGIRYAIACTIERIEAILAIRDMEKQSNDGKST